MHAQIQSNTKDFVYVPLRCIGTTHMAEGNTYSSKSVQHKGAKWTSKGLTVAEVHLLTTYVNF